MRPEDFAALGLAFKTAPTVGEALGRLARYILVLSDTLEYELRDDGAGAMFVLHRSHHGRGACLANECAQGAIASLMRQVAVSPVSPAAVSFRHARPAAARTGHSLPARSPSTRASTPCTWPIARC